MQNVQCGQPNPHGHVPVVGTPKILRIGANSNQVRASIYFVKEAPSWHGCKLTPDSHVCEEFGLTLPTLRSPIRGNKSRHLRDICDQDEDELDLNQAFHC